MPNDNVHAAKTDVLNKYYTQLGPGIDNWGGHWLVKHSVTNWRKGYIKLLILEGEVEVVNGTIKLLKQPRTTNTEAPQAVQSTIHPIETNNQGFSSPERSGRGRRPRNPLTGRFLTSDVPSSPPPIAPKQTSVNQWGLTEKEQEEAFYLYIRQRQNPGSPPPLESPPSFIRRASSPPRSRPPPPQLGRSGITSRPHPISPDRRSSIQSFNARDQSPVRGSTGTIYRERTPPSTSSHFSSRHSLIPPSLPQQITIRPIPMPYAQVQIRATCDNGSNFLFQQVDGYQSFRNHALYFLASDDPNRNQNDALYVILYNLPDTDEEKPLNNELDFNQMVNRAVHSTRNILIKLEEIDDVCIPLLLPLYTCI